MEELERTGTKLRTNPDGDVELGGKSFEDFIVPSCDECKRLGDEGETIVSYFGVPRRTLSIFLSSSNPTLYSLANPFRSKLSGARSKWWKTLKGSC